MGEVEKSESKASLGEKYWLQELCLSNGHDATKSDLSKVDLLELFLTVIPEIPCLLQYHSLSILRLVGCNIEIISNLDVLKNLKELWICEGRVKKLDGLTENSKLEQLYLYNNDIEKIENISHLLSLATLWLNKNKIEVIENLEQLRQLKFLNLSDNRIKAIGTSLICNNLLEEINLSGNSICSLKDITNLSCLRNLIALDLRDPMSLPNPVTLLCNYSTYVLYHMPSLKRLDSVDVSEKILKSAAESTVMKKKIFYKMKIRTIERQCIELKALLKEQLDNLQEEPVASIQKLTNATKEIERELDELSTKPEKLICPTKETNETKDETEQGEARENTEQYREKLEKKLSMTKNRTEFWEKVFKKLDSDFHLVYNQLQHWSKQSIHYAQLEFSSGGNIRFEEGSSADVWFNSCQDLIQARFTAQEFKDLSITGLKIHKITRVQNRLQKFRFDQKLEMLTENESESGIQYKDTSGRRLMDYLFLVPKACPLDCVKILEEGFIGYKDHQDSNGPAPIQITNSIRLFDKHRIKTTAPSTDKNNDCPYRYGQILVCKAYLGKSCAANNEKRVSQNCYAGYNSVFRTKKHLASNCPTRSKKSHLITSSTPTLSSEYCDCTARKCVWYVFDHDVVLPEYIVDFEYLPSVSPLMIQLFSYIASSYSQEMMYRKFEELQIKNAEDEDVDNEILNMEPVVPCRPRLTFLTEEMILKQTGQTYLNKITELNLHGCGLTKGKVLSTLPNIKKLILSFNEFTSMTDMGGNATLEYLDVSFNQITGMDGFKVCQNLTYLDISWNRFYYTRDDVGLLRKNVPALKTLRASHNLWMKEDSLRLRCIGRLRSLTEMDDIKVTEEETNIALRLAAGSRIAYITVLANSRTEKEPLKTLNLSSTTQVLMSQSISKPVKLSEDDKQWLARVTCLRLDGQHLSKISNLEKLENLKWASFNDNDITKIEGLENCKDLLELSLAKNCLSKIDGINHLTKLQSLDVSGNNLSSLDGIKFECFEELRFIAFDNNYVLSLNGLQHSNSLLEIYAGNNKLQELRDVFYLKSIPNLIILDLLGNPLVHESKNYRLFLIYHLQNLKALDGVPVDFTEGGIAKDTFGGKLSTDFIAEKLGHSNFLELCELDLPNCNIRTVDLPSSEVFYNLRSLNLEQNNLTSFGGIVNLHQLKVLCLNHNHIECIFPRKSNNDGSSSSQNVGLSSKATDDNTSLQPVLKNLEVLHLGYNGIGNIAALELGRLLSLKALFLQGNEISKVDGLDGLYELRELVLDKNKIKCFQENSFRHLWKLIELHAEENRLRDLSNLEALTSLSRLYVGLNRIQYASDLEKLECLPNLFELSVIGNPVSRRLVHRLMLVFRQPNLLSIDGIPVSNEERAKAELHFIEQQGGLQALQALSNNFEPSIPGLSNNIRNPLKVSNYPPNISNDRFWNPTQQQHYHHHGDQSDDKGNFNRNNTKRNRTSNKIPGNRYSNN